MIEYLEILFESLRGLLEILVDIPDNGVKNGLGVE